MKRIKVESDISATSYKALVKRLKSFNRKAILSIIDHYLVHVITDDNVKELLQILDEIDRSGTPVTAEFSEDEIDIPEGGVDVDVASYDFLRPKFPDLMTTEDLEANRDRLDLMFDSAYFDYLIPDDRQGLANKLIGFAEQNSLPVADHWRLHSGRNT